jgi:GNAT superfamily N-acetyltransferase
VLVRDAAPGDELEVARVHVRAWQSAYRGLLPDDHLDALREEERAARYTFGVHGAGAPDTLLALERGAILAFATVGPARDADAAGCGELYALYVDPSAWRRGIGRLLLERSEERMREGGYRQAILWVLDGNEAAARLYRDDGWAPDGAQRYEEVYGVGANVVRYRRAL